MAKEAEERLGVFDVGWFRAARSLPTWQPVLAAGRQLMRQPLDEMDQPSLLLVAMTAWLGKAFHSQQPQHH